MRKLNKDNYFILGILLFLAIGTAAFISYPATNTTYYTKEELREIIVGTALNYLYKNSYSDYNQKSFTDSPIVTNSSGKSITMYQTYNPRSFNTTPTSISRTNKYFIDCTSFVGSVYINALGYDFSEYYDNALDYNNGGTKPVQYFYKGSYVAANANKDNFKTAYKYHGKGNASGFFHSIGAEYSNSTSNPYTNDLASNTSPVVYYYKTPESGGKAVPASAQKKLLNVIRKGDIIIYQSYNSSGKLSGHALIYIGDELYSNHQATIGDTTFNNIGGVIHSTGKDFGTDASNDYGYDDFSIRYNSLNVVLDKLSQNKINQVTVLRPVNDLCNGTKDKCNVTLTDYQKAQATFSQLSTEQYVSISKTYKYEQKYQRESNEPLEKKHENTLSIYNSVNKGDEIIYNLVINNKNNYGFCSSDSPTDHPTKKSCTAAGKTWITRETSKRKTYNNLTITASIPSNTKYVSCSGCTYKDGKLTWTISVDSGKEKKLSYTVKVLDKNADINNKGFTIKNSTATLTMGNLKTAVNPTFNGMNIQILRKDVDTFKKLVNNNKITYSSSSTTNYKQKLSNINSSIALSNSDFIKMIYYNHLGIDFSYLTSDNIKSAVFKEYKTIKNVNGTNLTATNLFVKRTDTPENTNLSYISKMVVKGMYGGKKLQGNESLDRANFIRTYDFQVGDIIVIFDKNNLNNMTMYLYGGFENGEVVLYSFTKNGFQTHTKNNTNSGYEIIKTIYDSGLFVVLRPTQIFGTTVKLNYVDKVLTDKSFVTRLTYNYLPTSKINYQVTLNYNDNVTSPKTITTTKYLEWYTDSKYTTKVTNTSKLISSTTHTLYSKWGNVEIPTPVRSGYNFEGWYTDSSLTNKLQLENGKYIVDKNITLYAKWTENVLEENIEEEVIIYGDEEKNEIIIEIPDDLADNEGYDIYKYDEEKDEYEQVEYSKEENKYIVKHDFSNNKKPKVYLKKYKIDNGEKVYDKEENKKLEIPIEVTLDEQVNISDENKETEEKNIKENKNTNSSRLGLGIFLVIILSLILIILLFALKQKRS